ncbi:MAG: aminoacyl-tRNA hydrolase [Dongiaceae bacterium]
MLLLVGLGNPGPGHAGNRHNIGFMAVDEIVRRHGFGPARVRFHGMVADGAIAGEKTVALKPQTYMNDSGRAVAAAAHFYKLPPDRVLVIHDEVDLAPGRLRVKQGGGAGGHNGVRSVDAHIGPDYRRIRLGVGHPGHSELVRGYVLHDFAKEELPLLRRLIEAVAEALPLLVAGDENRFMSKVTVLTAPPKAKPDPDAGTDGL